ncbi:hypothetical protein Gogos_015364 [Gossypium gossypioides]|uniref:Uncharacterized protein n=1 Tax=Gossypium gossypioides TaxID=34282 RepID=A0A7J9C209_GOSGO|nr:hypothetical protein [Gossypium gossypioides]
MGHLDGNREFPLLSIEIDEALEQGVEAMRTLKLNGFNQKITRFNLGQKYKLLRQTVHTKSLYL